MSNTTRLVRLVVLIRQASRKVVRTS